MTGSARFLELSAFFWLFFATAYTTPARKPTAIAETDPRVTASPKKIIPDAATGSLLSAPTILSKKRSHQSQRRVSKEMGTHLYVVLLVARIHHAVVYEIPTAAAPENAMANKRNPRVSGGAKNNIR